MPAGLLLASLCLVVLTVVVSTPSVGKPDSGLSINQPDLLARVVGVSLGVPEVLMLLLGVVAFTQEFRYGTASSTFLVAPRRSRVLLAKWLGMTIASVPVTVATLAVSFGIGVPLIRSRGGSVTAEAALWEVVAAAFAVMAVFGVIGVAVGALVRNQVAAVVGVLVWMLAVEQVITSSYPAVGRWTPLGATFGLLQLGPAVTTKGDLLAAPVSGGLLLGYAVVACVLAFIITPRWDVL